MAEPTGEQSDRLTFLARIAQPFALAYAIFWLFNLDLGKPIPRDGTTLVIGRDFLNTWMVGRLAWGEHLDRFYHLATYQAEVAKVVGPDYLGQVWSYPPTTLLVGAPLGLLPYVAALGLWTLLGALVFGFALTRWTKDRRALWALLLCPAAIFGVISGQYAYFAAALMITVLRWRRSRPWAAGALLGLLTIKPQIGLFFPIMLLAARDWRVIVAALLSTVALVAMTMLLWGVAPWQAYLGEGIATQSAVLSDPLATVAPFMPTLFMNLRTIGVPVSAAGFVQLLFALVAVGVIAWRFARQPAADDQNANAIFLTASVVGTAYLLSYDTLPMTVGMLLALPPGKTGRWLTISIYFLTLIQIVLGTAGIAGPALIPLAALLYLVKQAASSTWVDQRNCPTG